MTEVLALLDAEAPSSPRGRGRVRQLRTWARRIRDRLDAATTNIRLERALRLTATTLTRMERQLVRAEKRGDLSDLLLELLPPLLSASRQSVDAARVASPPPA